MPAVRIRLSLLREAAQFRPPGYEQDVISRGELDAEGMLVIQDFDYAALCAKYDAGVVNGPGMELKRLLAGFPLYIKTTPTCACNKRARYMDRMGCEWCEQNLDQIVGWLKEEHQRRKMPVPFSALAAKQVVKLAIRRARRGNSQ